MSDLEEYREGRDQPGTTRSEERLLARGYMLGGLSPQERDEVERRFLSDSAFADLVLEEETDLFDALAAGELPSEQARALRLWASAQQRTQMRLEAAIAFQRLVRGDARNAVRPLPSKRRWMEAIRAPRFSALWLGGVAIASLAVMTASLWIAHKRPGTPVAILPVPSQTAPGSGAAAVPALPDGRNAEATAPSPALHAGAADVHPQAVATLFLMAEESRGSSAPAQLSLKPGITRVTLQLASEAGLSAGPYAIQLTGSDGSAMQTRRVHPRRLHGQRFLEVTLDAASLRPGEYTLLLKPKDAGQKDSEQKDGADQAPALSYHFQIAGS